MWRRVFLPGQKEMTEENLSPKSELIEENIPEVVNLIDSQVEKIEANLVRASRSYVGSLNAEEVELHQAIALDVDAHNLNANTSIMGVSHTATTSATNSILLAARADRMEFNNSLTGGIYSENASLGENSKTGILVGGKVSGDQIRTIFLVARHVEGQVETSLDNRQVVLASVLIGIACGVVLLLGQFLFRRKK
ncbi:MAG: hypothetical protein A2X25_04820 [Chloroflexi bacterium GWB2_49_20]|nr:MAG: hypothetical protein A2X25_04820 [Chloroflexi bacterium GWB2_49_20]OGN80509.1 MAG: hypothetical protein A2X26_11930 [Chloroflexi bacterium GWC2_49_37]OGN83344.1 MAG: hypothetical protein A2X27_12105 [Chloroflexi bacterium GWD2_49_16]HCC78167.1 hypothetical protein [Anaerolineae bacterium]